MANNNLTTGVRLAQLRLDSSLNWEPWDMTKAMSSDTGIQYVLGNLVRHGSPSGYYLYVNNTAGFQLAPDADGAEGTWLRLGVDTDGAKLVTDTAQVIDPGELIYYDATPAMTGNNDFVVFVRIGPQTSVQTSNQPTPASHTGWVYLQGRGSIVTDSAGTIISNLVIGRDILGAYDHTVVYGEGAEVEIIGGNAQITHWENLSGGAIAANIAPPVTNLLVSITVGQHIFPGQLARLPLPSTEAYARNNDQVATDLTLADIPVAGTAIGSVSNGWTRVDMTTSDWTEIFDRLPTNLSAYPDGLQNSNITLPTVNDATITYRINGADVGAITTNQAANETIDFGTITSGPGGPTVRVFADGLTYTVGDLVRVSTDLFVVTDATLAAAASNPANADSGFFAVGGTDTTHTIFYNNASNLADGDLRLISGNFSFVNGDLLFLVDQSDTEFERVEVWHIREVGSGIVVSATNIVAPGGVNIGKTAPNALTELRALLALRAVRTDNLGLLHETQLGAGFEQSGDHYTANIDPSEFEFVGGAITLKDGGVTNDKIEDRTIEHLKLADNAVTNRNIGDRAVHSDNIDYHTIIRSNLSFDLQAQLDARSEITVSETMGEVETGTIIRPSNIEGRDDWTMHVRPDNSRTISFTEVDAPDISIGDHFSLTAGSAAPPTGEVHTNAILRVPPVEVIETHTLTANVGQQGIGSFSFNTIQVNGVTASATNSITLRQGTYFRVANAIVALDSDTTFNSATMTVAGRLVNGATFPVGTNNALTPISETIDVTRVELDLIEGSMVGSEDLFTYLDNLTPASTTGGDAVFTFSPNSSTYVRRTIVHTAHGERVGNIAGANENDFVSNQAEFDVTEIRIGSGNSRNTAGTFAPLTGVDYTDVAVSWSSVAANGEIWLVWRGNQANIEGIINAMAAIMNVSSNTDTGIYFNGNPAGIIIPSASDIPYIRVIRNPTAYHANTANAISRALRISLRENGQRIANQLVSNMETLEPTNISSLFANGTFQLAHTEEVAAQVRFQGVDASGIAVGTLPVTRFGTQIQQDDDAIAVQTLYYSHNTNGAFPNPQTPDPGSRIRINEVPYSAGTTMSFAPEAGNSNNLIATISGPSAQRVADDLDRTFVSTFTSRIGALWFADSGDAFSEVNTRVGIDFTDVQSGHFLEAGRIRRYSPPVAVPLAAAERMTETGNAYTNTMISWRRDGDNFVVTVSGNTADKERVGSSLRNFLSERTANRSTLYFRDDGSTAIPANDAAARALPYLAINIPPIPGYSGGEGRITAIENQRARFPAPDSQFDQAGATLLSLYGLIDQDTETLRFGNGKTFTIPYSSGATNFTAGGFSTYADGQTIPSASTGDSILVAGVASAAPSLTGNTLGDVPAGMLPTGVMWNFRNVVPPVNIPADVWSDFLTADDVGTSFPGITDNLTLAFLLNSVNHTISGAPATSTTNPTGAITFAGATSAGDHRGSNRLSHTDLYDLFNVAPPATEDDGVFRSGGLLDRDGNIVRLRSQGGTNGISGTGEGVPIIGIGLRDSGGNATRDHGVILITGGTTTVANPQAGNTGADLNLQRRLMAMGTSPEVPAGVQTLNTPGFYRLVAGSDNGYWVRQTTNT